MIAFFREIVLLGLFMDTVFSDISAVASDADVLTDTNATLSVRAPEHSNAPHSAQDAPSAEIQNTEDDPVHHFSATSERRDQSPFQSSSRIKQDAKEALKQGVLHTYFRERYRIVSPESDEGVAFNKSLQDFTKKHLPELIEKLGCVPNFYLSDTSEPNAAVFKDSNPPAIMLNSGLFKAEVEIDGVKEKILQSPGDLLFYIGHEIGHALKSKIYGPSDNSKAEEGALYSLPLVWVHDAGFNPVNAAESLTRLVAYSNVDKKKVRFDQFLDPHPIPINIDRILSATLTSLHKSRGIQATADTDLPAIELEIGEIYQVALHARHTSWLNSKLGEGFEELPLKDKLTKLTNICGEIDYPYPIRIRELADTFASLSGALIDNSLDTEFKNLTTAFFKIAEKDSPLSRGASFSSAMLGYASAYSALTHMHDGKKARRPLGRLTRITKRSRELIAACESGEREQVVRACRNFNRAVLREPLMRTFAGKAIFSSVNMPKFKYPHEAIEALEDIELIKSMERSGDRVSKSNLRRNRQTIKDSIVSWQALRRFARHPEVMNTLCLVGLKNDRQILESIQKASGLRALKLHIAIARPARTMEQLFFEGDPKELSLTKGGRVNSLLKNDKIPKTPPNQHLWIQSAFRECEQEIIDGYREGNKSIIELAEEALPYLSANTPVEELRRFDIAEEFPELFLAINGLCHYDDTIARVMNLSSEESERCKFLNAALSYLTTLEKNTPGTCTKALQLAVDSIHNAHNFDNESSTIYSFHLAGGLVESGALRWINNLPDSINSQSVKSSSLSKYSEKHEWHEYDTKLISRTLASLGIPDVFDVTDIDELITRHKEAAVIVEGLAEEMWFSKYSADMKFALSSFTLCSLKHMLRENDDTINPEQLFELIAILDEQVLKYEVDDGWRQPLVEKCQRMLNRDIRVLKSALKSAKTDKALHLAGKLGALGLLSLSDEVNIQQGLLARIRKYKSANTRMSLACMLISPDVRVSPSVEIRGVAKEIIIAAMRVDIGLDDGSKSFTKSLKKKAEKMLESTTKSEHLSLLRDLADAVVSQEESGFELEELSKKLSENELKGAAGYGIIAEIVMTYARHSPEQLNNCLEFLLSPKESAGNKKFLTLMQDAIGAYQINSHDYDRDKFLKLPKFLQEDPTSGHSERFLNDQARAWHQNFWRQPLDVRAILIRECLLGENDTTTAIDIDLFDMCMKKTFNGNPVADVTRDYIFSYLQALPDFSKHLGLAALTVAGERVRGGASEEEAIASLLEYLGALHTKAGQRGASSSLVKNDKRHIFNRLKYNANKEPRWDTIKRAKERRGAIEKGCSEFYGEQVTVVSWGEVLGSASVSIGLEFTLSNGATHVLSLRRPHVEDQSNEGARVILDALEKLELEESKKSAPIVKSLIVEAREQLLLETNTMIAKSQFDQAQEDAYGLSVSYGKRHYEIDAVQVLACGEDWYVMTKAEGEHFAEEAMGSQDPEESRNLAVVNLAVELRNIFRGAFDTDRHGGNLKHIKQGNTTFIKHFDLKAYQFGTIDEEAISELISFFRGFNVDEFAPDEFMEQMFLTVEEDQLHPYVRKVRNSLIGLAEYVKVEGFTKQDLTVSLISALRCEDISPLVPKVIRDHFPEEMHSFVDNFFSGDLDLSFFGLTEEDLVHIKKRSS